MQVPLCTGTCSAGSPPFFFLIRLLQPILPLTLRDRLIIWEESAAPPPRQPPPTSSTAVPQAVVAFCSAAAHLHTHDIIVAFLNRNSVRFAPGGRSFLRFWQAAFISRASSQHHAANNCNASQVFQCSASNPRAPLPPPCHPEHSLPDFILQQVA